MEVPDKKPTGDGLTAKARRIADSAKSETVPAYIRNQAWGIGDGKTKERTRELDFKRHELEMALAKQMSALQSIMGYTGEERDLGAARELIEVQRQTSNVIGKLLQRLDVALDDLRSLLAQLQASEKQANQDMARELARRIQGSESKMEQWKVVLATGRAILSALTGEPEVDPDDADYNTKF